MTAARIVIADEHTHRGTALRPALLALGFEVGETCRMEEVLDQRRVQDADVLLLNRPALTTIRQCKAIRAISDIPIIIISAKPSSEETTAAFEAGVDQIFPAPVASHELAARVRMLLRRVNPDGPDRISLGDIEVNFKTRDVKRPDGVVHLTAKQFKLLHFLASHPGQIMPHRRILQAVWGPDYGNEVEYLRTFVNQLRKKIEMDPANPSYLRTERSVGYCLATPGHHRRYRNEQGLSSGSQ